MWRNMFVLKMEQQENEPFRLCLISNTCFLSIAHPVGMYSDMSMVWRLSLCFIDMSLHTHVKSIEKDTDCKVKETLCDWVNGY